MDGEQYDFGYYDTNVYGHVVGLVARLRRSAGELHLDLGCGFGVIAEKCREMGLTYVGLDIQTPGRASLERRGFESGFLDLQDVASLGEQLRAIIAGRPVASISLIDTLEHVTTGSAVLREIASVAVEHGDAPLVVAVPNVTHRDLGAKLLVGRWDYTPTGLLDETHVIHHTESLLTAMAEQGGWREVGAHDFTLGRSDQFFPPDLPVLGDQTTLGRFLSAVSDRSNPLSEVNELVRAYVPGRPVVLASQITASGHQPEVFLSILVRTQARRPEQLRDALLCLVGQENQDFELIVLPHKVSVEQQIEVEQLVEELPGDVRSRSRVLPVDTGGRAGPLNVGVAAAKGRYIAVLDDDDLVLGHWVDEFATLAARHPGRVLRTVAVTQDISEATWPGVERIGHRATSGTSTRYASTFDLIDHFRENHSPLMTLAFPRSLFTDMRMSFDESLHIMEDWDFLLRSALICGVGSAPTITAIYRRWTRGEASHTVHTTDEWVATQRRIIDRLDGEPQLLPPGSIRRLLGQSRTSVNAQDAGAARLSGQPDEVARLREELALVHSSRSWRATAVLRGAGRTARALRRRTGLAR